MASQNVLLFDEVERERSDSASARVGFLVEGDPENSISQERLRPYLSGSFARTSSANRIDDIDVELLTNLLSPISRDIVPVLWRPRSAQRRSSSKSAERLEGVVLEVLDDSFIARLVDLNGQAPDEEAEILLDEITDEDRILVQAGSVFYWCIGYHTDASRQVRRQSIIRFRRLPTWTKREIQQAKREAQATSQKLGWGNELIESSRSK
ncbi:MAG: hypothetical protein GKR94_32475 [Gammaproteobacteria bacterium]|nr:hypothetical protein [Gammaproteobacteria bacterium]